MTNTKDMTEKKTSRILPIWLALTPLVLLMVMLVFTVRAFGDESLGGPSQIVMLAASSVCCVIGRWAGKVRWRDLKARLPTASRRCRRQWLSCCLLGHWAAHGW